MILKEKFHTGDPSVPSIFLIEFCSEEAFSIKFESIKPFLFFNQPRKVDPAVCLFPWFEYTKDVFECSWVLTEHDKLKIDDEELEVKEFNLNLKGIQELFRSWSQSLLIDSLKKDIDVQSRAKKALNIVEDILAEVKEKKNIDILELSKEVDVSNKSFKERAWINFLKKNYERTIWYYQQIKDMTEGKNASNMNDFDAAKEIMVGTIVGNYQKKLNSLKNITPAEFQKMKNEFKKTYESLHLVPEQGQNALYSLFAEASFLDGLNDCKNPFDLVENFPLSGVLMKINKASVPNSVFEI